MTTKLDCRGLTCSELVRQVRDNLAQERSGMISIIVENENARDNVSRVLTQQGCMVEVTRQESDYLVTGSSGAGPIPLMTETGIAASAGDSTRKILIMVTTDRLGQGDDTLGKGLLLNMLKTLNEMGPELWRLVFVNAGVKLTTRGADTVPILQELAGLGVSILVCGTCLNHFQLLDKKEVGETTNMLDIVTSLQLADSVINF